MNRPEKIEAAEAASLAAPAQAARRQASPCPEQDISLPCGPQPYFRKLERVLDRMGNTHLLSDILTAIHEGRMQSFAENNSWAVTQLQDFPRARQLQLIAMVGDLADIDSLHSKILAYADEVNAGLLSTYGRLGWLREGSWQRLGWRLKARSQLYQREM